MLKKITVASLLSLGMLSASGCRSQDQTENHSTMTTQEVEQRTLVPNDRIPEDVIRTVHQHVMPAHIISAETMTWKGRMAYQIYARSGNNVYILKIRPDGYFLSSMLDVELDKPVY